MGLSFRSRIAIAALLPACLAGCGRREQARFQAEQRQQAAGYHLEHFEQERLLFVHHPNGEKDGVDLTKLQRVFLHRQNASDSVDGKARYFWRFGGSERVVTAPFFSADPSLVIRILDRELPDFDEVTGTKMAAAFSRNQASFCLLWASPGYLKETRSSKQAECEP